MPRDPFRSVDEPCEHSGGPAYMKEGVCADCWRERAIEATRMLRGYAEEVRVAEQALWRGTGCGVPAEEVGGAPGELTGMEPLAVLAEIAEQQLKNLRDDGQSKRIDELLARNTAYVGEVREGRWEVERQKLAQRAVLDQNLKMRNQMRALFLDIQESEHDITIHVRQRLLGHFEGEGLEAPTTERSSS